MINLFDLGRGKKIVKKNLQVFEAHANSQQRLRPGHRRRRLAAPSRTVQGIQGSGGPAWARPALLCRVLQMV